MTVKILYRNVDAATARLNQLQMAKQIESNRGFPISDVTRRVEGNRFTVEVETDLPSQAVENMLSDIGGNLNPEAEHVETREV
jgi:ribosomal protein L20A (L18A)